MAYTPRWERLSEALTRVVEACELTQNDAKADICRAISDGAIKIRAELGRHITKRITSRGTILEGSAFQIPTRLTPKDLDWQRSRPLKPWVVRREAFRSPGLWDLEWIELFRPDVTNELYAATNENSSADLVSTKRVSNRSRPTFDRAKRAVDALYPNGAPNQATEPNKILCRRINEWLKDKRLTGVSDETILRAAGRRK